MRIQEFLTELLPLRDGDNYNNNIIIIINQPIYLLILERITSATEQNEQDSKDND